MVRTALRLPLYAGAAVSVLAVGVAVTLGPNFRHGSHSDVVRQALAPAASLSSPSGSPSASSDAPPANAAHVWGKMQYAERAPVGSQPKISAAQAMLYYRNNAMSARQNATRTPTVHYWLYTNTFTGVSRLPIWALTFDGVHEVEAGSDVAHSGCIEYYVVNANSGDGLFDLTQC